VSSVPAEIAGIGSTSQKLRVSPGFDPLKAQVGPDEYFLLSRIDGTQTLRDVLLATGLPVERGIAIVTKLRSIGAVLLPGETQAPVPAQAPAKAGVARTQASATPARAITPPSGISIPGTIPKQPPKLPPLPKEIDLDAPTHVRTQEARAAEAELVLPNMTADERAAMAETTELAHAEKIRILAMARLIDGRDPYALLGVPPGSEAKVLKRAYFKLSKDIHPDRFYGKQLGSYGDKLTAVFEAVSRAYAHLTNPDKQGKGTGAYPQASAEQPQTPQEYAVELFERACALEVSGDALGAMKLFSAAVRIDAATKYLRRAASCALAAGQPRSAVEYAKKAQTQSPDDPSSARLLAAAFRACGKLADAEEVLVMAMALKSENDVLTAELRNDLAEVRRLLSS
jgi:hypothetical protein